MLRMLIVDDERIVRETIRDIIEWDRLGIEVAGVCKNGLEAYDMILDEYPDIVLTDIKMPGLSGLDLIKRITQGAHSTEFVILSGYGDYAYTKEAMKLGIQYYLLKPCNEKEIIEVIEEVKKNCFRKRLRQAQRQENCEMLKQLHESVAHNLLAESLTEHPDFEALQKQYEQFLSFTNVGYEICKVKNLQDSLRAGCIEAFQEYHSLHAEQIPCYCLHADDELYIGFESYDYDYTKLDACMEAACGQIGCYQRISMRCLNDLLPQIHFIMKTHSCVTIGFKRSCLHYSQMQIPQEPLVGTNCDFIAKVMEIVHENIEDPNLSLKQISENYLYMNVDYVSRKFLKATGCKFSAFLADVRIAKAKSLLCANRAMSVNAVADAVGCGNNPQYFSQLFKKVAGITPTEYIKSIGG